MKKPRRERKLCSACRDHRAVSRYRGVVAWRKDHTLCPSCFRSLRDRARAFFLTAAPVGGSAAAPAASAA